VRSKVWPVLSAFYTSYTTTHETSNHQLHRIRQELLNGTRNELDIPARRVSTYTAREPCNYPLHRKLRLSAYINKKQSDARFRKFGKKAVYVMGNWSAPMQRYHEPARGKGMRRMMREHGQMVYLIDEYKTSKYCPACCTGMLAPCKMQRNPPPVGSDSGSGSGSDSDSTGDPQEGDSNCSGSDPWEGDGDPQPGSGDHALIGNGAGDQQPGGSQAPPQGPSCNNVNTHTNTPGWLSPYPHSCPMNRQQRGEASRYE
ncbi:hypothetical protein LPJ61_003610, partial [Coemansia biformis]